MDLVTRDCDGIVLVSPEGRLDLSTYVQLRDGLLKHAAEQPSAVVVELTDAFEIGSDSLASVFSTVWLRIAPWSGVRMMLVPLTTRHQRMLARTGVGRFVPTYSSGAEARSSPVDRCRAEVQLHRDNAAANTARMFVLRECDRWDVKAATVSIVLIAGELVENALKHTDSAPTLRVERFPRHLTVAVRDGEPMGDGPPARGTALLGRLANAWGHSTTLDGGKLVWATVSI
jgi:anti-anti-sigma regulatory factor